MTARGWTRTVGCTFHLPRSAVMSKRSWRRKYAHTLPRSSQPTQTHDEENPSRFVHAFQRATAATRAVSRFCWALVALAVAIHHLLSFFWPQGSPGN